MNEKNFIQNTFDEPIIFKGLKIYPAPLKKYYEFFYGLLSITIDKNSIPDPEVISMSYLDFLYFKNNDENENIKKLLFLLLVVFRIEINEINIDEKNGKVNLIIKDVTIDGKDFDKIKEIILEQNYIEIPNENMHPETRKKMDEAKKYKSKMSGTKPAGLEDQIICIISATGMKLQDVYDLTIRKFMKILERVDHKLHYQIYLSASMSGLVEFKNKDFIKHWMADLSRDAYEDVKVGYDEIKDKIEMKR